MELGIATQASVMAVHKTVMTFNPKESWHEFEMENLCPCTRIRKINRCFTNWFTLTHTLAEVNPILIKCWYCFNNWSFPTLTKVLSLPTANHGLDANPEFWYVCHPPCDSRAVHVAFHSVGRTVVQARKSKSCLGWTSNSTNCCDTVLCSRAVRTPASLNTPQRNDSKSYITLFLIVSSSVLPWEKFRIRRACDWDKGSEWLAKLM